MVKSIIGNTGFVGSNLIQQYNFDNLYNSKNIQDIINVEHDIVFCCAPSAIKWIANKHPIDDLTNILNLLKILEKVKIKKFILYSTIDIYGQFCDQKLDEDSYTNINVHPYGKNRLIFESYISNMFDCNIIRLPGLFGNFLKKNVIFDLQNNNLLENINLNSSFQWLYLNRLKQYTDFVIDNNIKVLNCVTEPLSNYEIVNTFFSNKMQKCDGINYAKYDIKSKYFDSGYCMTKNQVIKDLQTYLLK